MNLQDWFEGGGRADTLVLTSPRICPQVFSVLSVRECKHNKVVKATRKEEKRQEEQRCTVFEQPSLTALRKEIY